MRQLFFIYAFSVLALLIATSGAVVGVRHLRRQKSQRELKQLEELSKQLEGLITVFFQDKMPNREAVQSALEEISAATRRIKPGSDAFDRARSIRNTIDAFTGTSGMCHGSQDVIRLYCELVLSPRDDTEQLEYRIEILDTFIRWVEEWNSEMASVFAQVHASHSEAEGAVWRWKYHIINFLVAIQSADKHELARLRLGD